MVEIFVNLKRFDVPRTMGGVCPHANPKEWIEWVMHESVALGLGAIQDLNVTYLLPEGLIISANETLQKYPDKKTGSLQIGCQGVFREDITAGGNFGAFTSNLPARAAKNLGCTWSMIGHSEERKDKLGIISAYDSDCQTNSEKGTGAAHTVNRLINQEVLCALHAEMDVVLCVGETAAEKGEGAFDDQKSRIKTVLKDQLITGLQAANEYVSMQEIVIGYEPVWAIGPGKIPPDAAYIAFVSSFIKTVVMEVFGFTPPVVYGGGLKTENAGLIANIKSIDGGLVALTKFTGEIAFEPEGLKDIIDTYLQ